MVDTVKRLSEEEKEFAEKNIGILFAFMKRYHLPEDYFGELAVAYVRYIGRYLDAKDKYPYSFTTLVWQRLRSELSHISRKEKKQQLTILASDAMESEGQFDDYFEKELLEEVNSRLTHKQSEVLLLRIEGYTNHQIAGIAGISVSAVERRFKRIRKHYQMENT